MTQTRPLTDAERVLITQALQRDAERVMQCGLNPELMAALVAQESVPDGARSALADRALAQVRKATSLELLADIIHRHGATITTPTVIPEQG